MAEFVNLGCGADFVDSPAWANLDYAPVSPAVTQADLLGRLPFADGSMSLVYASHFIEHVPRAQVAGFLAECFRVLRPGGVVRLVTPDLEEMSREYLRRREAGEHDKADFVAIEMLDQCVRMEPGGALGRLYARYLADPARHAAMIDYVRQRTGKRLGPGAKAAARPPRPWGQRLRKRWDKLGAALARGWFRLLVALLPAAARAQNVSFTRVGERHHWIWDFWQLSAALEAAGFAGVTRQAAGRSGVAGFPCDPLDVDASGAPRKGAESIYVEARKPGAG